MPPKRKAAAAKGKKGPPAKKAKTEIEQVKTVLKKGPSFRKKVHKVDKAATQFSNGSIVEDYDCMLNQTNIDRNNNKYYVIQLIQNQGKYYVWTRWGRVGEPGSNLTLGPFAKKEDAVKKFEAKFSSKTLNDWSDRNKFKPVKGKYTLLEMADDDDDVVMTKPQPTLKAITAAGEYAPSSLDTSTQNLMDIIFETDMFQNAMVEFKLDTKKLPLGKLSKPQIMKGFEVLEELEQVISGKKKGNITELSSKFYTIIPHSFGRQVPPKISTAQDVREKMDMLLVLSDIESTQAMLRENETKKTTKVKAILPPHPLDEKYKMLEADLTLVDRKSNEFKIIHEFVETTKSRNISIIDVWRVERKGEDERYRVHKNIANRKLLWHGTNIAVVAAILKSGLRIMPHSGGRVGKGLYFASENGKSSWYVSGNRNNVGVMFLNEVALGKENKIFQDNSSLTHPPKGFNSVVAQGRQEPDESSYKELKFNNSKVIVPVGKPKTRSLQTSFHQSEYLIYQESQCRIRYLILCKF